MIIVKNTVGGINSDGNGFVLKDPVTSFTTYVILFLTRQITEKIVTILSGEGVGVGVLAAFSPDFALNITFGNVSLFFHLKFSIFLVKYNLVYKKRSKFVNKSVRLEY